MKKKIVSVMLAMSLMAGILVGCASTSTPETDVKEESSDVIAEAGSEATGDFKIGVNYIIEGSYNVLANKNVEESAITAFGGTPMSLCANGSVEQTMADFENMIDSGCDGILIWFLYDEMLYTVMEECEEAGVYFAFSDKAPTNPEVIAAANANPYFAGTVVPDHEKMAVECAEAALEAGCTNAIICSPGVGDATGEPRIAAFTKKFEAGGGKIITKIQEQEAPDNQTSLENFLSGYDGEFDVIFCTNSDRVNSAHLGAVNSGYSDVQIVCADLNMDVLNKLNEGWLLAVVGDAWASSFYSYVLIANALNGTPILDADGNKPWIDTLGCFSLSTEEELAFYQKYFLDNFYFSEEECSQMLLKNNHDYNYDAFVKDVTDFSLESRMAQFTKEGRVTEEEIMLHP